MLKLLLDEKIWTTWTVSGWPIFSKIWIKGNLESIIKVGVNARKELLEYKYNKKVSVQPEFAEAFQNFMNFLGMSNDRKYDAFNQIRRTPHEELDELKQEGALNNDRDSFLQEMKRLRQEHTEIVEALKDAALKQLIQAEHSEVEQHQHAPC